MSSRVASLSSDHSPASPSFLTAYPTPSSSSSSSLVDRAPSLPGGSSSSARTYNIVITPKKQHAQQNTPHTFTITPRQQSLIQPHQQQFTSQAAIKPPSSSPTVTPNVSSHPSSSSASSSTTATAAPAPAPAHNTTVNTIPPSSSITASATSSTTSPIPITTATTTTAHAHHSSLSSFSLTNSYQPSSSSSSSTTTTTTTAPSAAPSTTTTTTTTTTSTSSSNSSSAPIIRVPAVSVATSSSPPLHPHSTNNSSAHVDRTRGGSTILIMPSASPSAQPLASPSQHSHSDPHSNSNSQSNSSSNSRSVSRNGSPTSRSRSPKNVRPSSPSSKHNSRSNSPKHNHYSKRPATPASKKASPSTSRSSTMRTLDMSNMSPKLQAEMKEQGISEREIRKEILRQKNSLHMRLHSIQPNPAIRPSVTTPKFKTNTFHRAMTFANTTNHRASITNKRDMKENDDNYPTKLDTDDGNVPLPEVIPSPRKRPSLSMIPSTVSDKSNHEQNPSFSPKSKINDDNNNNNITVLPSQTNISPKALTSNPVLNPMSTAAPVTSPIFKRQLSGILRSPSLRGPGIVRANTIGSRVGFAVPDENESDENDMNENDHNNENDTQHDEMDEQSTGQHSPRSKSKSTKGDRLDIFRNPKLRKSIFVKQGDQLMLRSVSTSRESTGGQANEAANVMVLSVSSIFNRLRLYTDLCFYLAMLGMLLCLIQKELYYHYGDSANTSITIIRALCSLSTVLLIFCLYKYYQADFQFLQLNRVYLLRSAFWNTQLIWQFCAEVLICLIHEPPYLNHDVDISVVDVSALNFYAPSIVRNPWSLLMCLRFYLVLRLVLSRYYTGGTKILGLWFNFGFNVPFATRNMMFSHPFLSLAPVVFVLVFSCSYAMWVFEREAQSRDFGFMTSMWLIFITITAVGYGDVFPVTAAGRGISVISAFFGIVWTAVLVAAVHQKLTLLPYEGRMVEFLERDTNSLILKYYAARCIQRSWKYYSGRMKCVALVHSKRFTIVHRARLIRLKTVMLQGIFDFQTSRKQIQAYDRRYHSEQLFRSMLETLYDKLETISLDVHVLDDELDIQYEEQKKMFVRQEEMIHNKLQELTMLASTNRSDVKPISHATETSTTSKLQPEHGSIKKPVDVGDNSVSDNNVASPSHSMPPPIGRLVSPPYPRQYSNNDSPLPSMDSPRADAMIARRKLRLSRRMSNSITMISQSHGVHASEDKPSPLLKMKSVDGLDSPTSPGSPLPLDHNAHPSSLPNGESHSRRSRLNPLRQSLTSERDRDSPHAGSTRPTSTRHSTELPTTEPSRHGEPSRTHKTDALPLDDPDRIISDSRRGSHHGQTDLLKVVQLLNSSEAATGAPRKKTKFGESDIDNHVLAVQRQKNRGSITLKKVPEGVNMRMNSVTGLRPPSTQPDEVPPANYRSPSINYELLSATSGVSSPARASPIPNMPSIPSVSYRPGIPRAHSSALGIGPRRTERLQSYSSAEQGTLDKLMTMMTVINERLTGLEQSINHQLPPPIHPASLHSTVSAAPVTSLAPPNPSSVANTSSYSIHLHVRDRDRASPGHQRSGSAMPATSMPTVSLCSTPVPSQQQMLPPQPIQSNQAPSSNVSNNQTE